MDQLFYISECVARFDTMKADCSVLEHVILVLVCPKTFLSFKCLAVLFQVSETTVHRYFYGTIQPQAAVLDATIPWPNRNEIIQNEPHCYSQYRDIRIVLDYTQVEIGKCHCISCCILTYSFYKGVHTLKVLIHFSWSPPSFFKWLLWGWASDKVCVYFGKDGALQR